MCLASEGWDSNRAVAWLREAGTAEDYPGLYRAAQVFTAPTRDQLAAIRELPEIATSSSLVDAMVAIDAHYENLKQSQKVSWQTPPGHADVSPAHEATILWEHFREMARTPDTVKRPADFRTKLADSERLALALRALLRSPTEPPKIDRAFKAVSRNCIACHQQHRNQQ
jgi:cytochrome c556